MSWGYNPDPNYPGGSVLWNGVFNMCCSLALELVYVSEPAIRFTQLQQLGKALPTYIKERLLKRASVLGKYTSRHNFLLAVFFRFGANWNLVIDRLPWCLWGYRHARKSDDERFYAKFIWSTANLSWGCGVRFFRPG
jgi:hypothetical protein